MCTCDIRSHGDTLRADSIWHETRGMPLFSEGLGYHPTVWTAALMVLPCATVNIPCAIDAVWEAMMDMVVKTEVIAEKTFGRLTGRKAGIQLKQFAIE